MGTLMRRWKQAAVCIAGALLMLANQAARADPTGVNGAPVEGIFGEGASGKGQTDSKTGAMTWSFPFILPTARGRSQGRLSLNYNSSSRDREAGYGWGLDLPVIERRPLSGNPCFTATGKPIVCGSQGANAQSDEHYTYSGQSLVMVCEVPKLQSNSATVCGKELQPAWALSGGWRYFRLQVEGQFARFYLAENRRYWLVQLKGGELLEFGEPPNRNTAGVEHAFAKPQAILRWRLVRQSDVLHQQNGAPTNYVEYRWKEIGRRGLLFLTDIYDTPRANSPRSDAAFAHHTRLTWQPPDYPQTHYADPYRATPDLRLARVAVASMPWSGTGPREIIRTYSLGYAPAQDAVSRVALSQVFYPWHHSFLSEIQMQGRCNQFEDERGDAPSDRECRGPSLPSTRFEYEDGHPTFGIASMTKVQGGPADAVERGQVLPFIQSTGVVDFNRDGLPDIVQGWKSNLDCGTTTAGNRDIANSDPDVLDCLMARPMVGYLNRGTGLYVQLEHQCFDAGTISDITGLSHYGAGVRDGFFTSTGGATLVGPWSEGVLAWSNAQYAAFRAKPLLPEYDLNLVTVGDTSAIPNSGKSVVYVAKIGAAYFIRIFDSKGKLVSDRRGVDLLSQQATSQVDAAFALPSMTPQDKSALARLILASADYARPFESGSGCDVEQFTKADFHPAWKWEKTQNTVDWMKPSPNEPKPSSGEGPYSRLPRWFADIDGDGLVDRLASTGEPALDFETAYVEFTQLYAKNAALPGGGKGPAQLPFVFDFNQLPHSLVPSFPGSKRGTKYFYVDINGDGLVDLVTVNSSDNAGIPQVRPGDGHGEFACIDTLQPWPCQEPSTEISRLYGIEITGPRLPWPFNDETYFHDVTGDGLADIVQYDMASGEVRLWINQDGHRFACAVPSCVAGKVLSVHAETRGLSGAAAWDIGEHRVTFADMNGDGVDDIVILAREGAYVGAFMTKYVAAATQGPNRGFAPRPGLLTRVHNGIGATTDIQYHSIQQLDLAAAADPATAWQYHSPVVESAVTQIVTQDSYHAGGNLNAITVSAPYQFKNVAQYIYQNPAYDRWSRRSAGFRKVIAHYGNEAATTTTTYWFGPCDNNQLNVRLMGSPDLPLCQEGSDDDAYKAITGRVVRIDRGNESLSAFQRQFTDPTRQTPPNNGPKLLWTKTFQYTTSTLFNRDDRKISFSWPGRVDTYLYDDAKPTMLAGVSPGPSFGGDLRIDPPLQKDIRRHLVQQLEYDEFGSLKRVTERGSVKDEGSATDDAAITTLYSSGNPSSADDALNSLSCTTDWVCLPQYVSMWLLPSSPGDSPLRKNRLTYTSAHDVETVEGWLDRNALPLDRRHTAGPSNTAPPPAGQALASGWHLQRTLSYDLWGNVTRSAGSQTVGGSPADCTASVYDGPYQQFPALIQRFTNGCAGPALESRTEFDRGFEQLSRVTTPTGSVSEIRYDAFGRPNAIYLPNPEAAAGTQKPVLAKTIAYSDREPLSHVEVRQIVGPTSDIRSITILNGLGEPVAGFSQGDNNDWILKGWHETNLSGQVQSFRRPWTYSGDPVNAALKALSPPIPFDNTLFQIHYDDFGRRDSVKETGASFSQELGRNSYFPLIFEARDAEQLKPGGPHSKAFQRTEYDGHGRVVLSKTHVASPVADDITTSVIYTPTGEPIKIIRSQGGSAYERTMEYDSLGRLMQNREPNTGNNWRYVWDDSGRLVGTSDARGCGENLYYDGLDRVTGEDYSPCLNTHPAYTSPNLATGAGLEVLYKFDTYEPGQVSPEPGFVDDAAFAIGKLVAVHDRGSHTRINYDARARVRRLSRQIATPDASGANSFAAQWFRSRMDFDIGDRLTRRTSGAEAQELLVSGTSEERYVYSARGKVMGIDSSYGPLVKSVAYDAENSTSRIVFGDKRTTTERFGYDERHRLSLHQLIAPPTGSAAPIGYFDHRFPSYDDAGNPLVINDFRIAWTPLPPEAAPVETQTMEYDDLYRLIQISSAYKTRDGKAPWASPYALEIIAGDNRPAPLRSLPTRTAMQSFQFGAFGNLESSSDDLSAQYDRSLGTSLGYGTAQNGPNQLRSANGLTLGYDAAGNMADLKVERPGNCPSDATSKCAQWYAYDWDEVGELVRARRWDFAGNSLPTSPTGLPSGAPEWDLTYAYSQGMRVRKTASRAAGQPEHSLTIFDSLRADHAPFDAAANNYKINRDNTRVYLGGLAYAFWDQSGQLPHQATGSSVTMHLRMGDHLGSSSVVINHATSELVERTTYQPYGAVESDHRPAKWNAFRDPYKFTDKEEDIEVGAIYFGARYYQPYLGRFLSPDPLTIHAMASDFNPYAYVRGRVTTQVDRLGLCSGGYPIASGTVTYEYDCATQSKAEDKAARAGDIASRERKPPLVRQQPQVKPATPDWTTQTEWAYPKPDRRLMQPVTSIDTGNRSLNFALNKVLLPWRNALAFYENIPLAFVIGVDEALEQSAIQVEYRNAPVVLGIAPAMGISVEAGPALTSISGRFGKLLSALVAEQRASVAEENLWSFVNTKSPDDVYQMVVEVEHMAMTPGGRQNLRDILSAIPAKAQNLQEQIFFFNVRAAIEHSLKQYP
jgi:RHS repeat-associated protein